MTTIMPFIKRHAVVTFYIVVFVISWGGFLIAVGLATSMAVVEIPPVAILSMVAGPIVASILLTSLVYGRTDDSSYYTIHLTRAKTPQMTRSTRAFLQYAKTKQAFGGCSIGGTADGT